MRNLVADAKSEQDEECFEDWIEDINEHIASFAILIETFTSSLNMTQLYIEDHANDSNIVDVLNCHESAKSFFEHMLNRANAWAEERNIVLQQFKNVKTPASSTNDADVQITNSLVESVRSTVSLIVFKVQMHQLLAEKAHKRVYCQYHMAQKLAMWKKN